MTDALVEQCQAEISILEKENRLNRHEVDQVKSKFLSKKSEISNAYKSMSGLSSEQRREQGQKLNLIRTQLNELIQQAYVSSDEKVIEEKISESVDVTAKMTISKGSLHPLTHAYQEMTSILTAMGFEIALGPHIEDEYHNFTALNFPKDHPAVTMHDTFYIKNVEKLLRTHTSTVQVHVLNKKKPPLRIATPGQVYRCDHDLTHSPMFNQMECLVVNETCNFSELKWLVIKFCEAYLGKALEYRFRPSFFPFTEPSAEIDIVWNDSWLELGGCGMVHPNVLEEAGIDSKQYKGFAFGMGIDRLAMLKYGVNDLRLFYENHIEFLEQF